jgi:glycosyltransferase involved in cell wall biosynthesis
MALSTHNKIIIIAAERFPKGGATANRILSIAKGLKFVGEEVEVICLRPADRVSDSIINNPSGEYQGINYSYIHKTTKWPNNKFCKLWFLISMYFYIVPSLYKIIIEDRVQTILITTDDFFLNIQLKLFSIFFHGRIFLVLDEYPPFMRHGNYLSKLFGKITNNFRYRFCDGMILITNVLINYYKGVTGKRVKFFKLPMSVEVDRFQNVEPIFKSQEHYLAYCGFEPEIDGLDLLFKAFALIHLDDPNLKLLIIGDTPDGRFRKYKQIASDLGIVEKVNFTGIIDRDKVPNYLLSASVLILPRPLSTSANGGFPTKIGEYLATKKPVLVTNTGEIGIYLKDKVSCYLIESGDIEAISNSIKYIFNNYDEALKVGEMGFDVACSYFDYKVQAKELLNFLKKGE